MFETGTVVTVGKYGRVLWTVDHYTRDGLAVLRNVCPIVGSPHFHTTDTRKLSAWAGKPKAARTPAILRNF